MNEDKKYIRLLYDYKDQYKWTNDEMSAIWNLIASVQIDFKRDAVDAINRI